MVTPGDAFLLPTASSISAFGVVLAIHDQAVSVRFQNGLVGRMPLADVPAFQSCLLALSQEIATPRLKEI